MEKIFLSTKYNMHLTNDDVIGLLTLKGCHLLHWKRRTNRHVFAST